MQLFISHASEDKDDFVRPLAEELKLHFSVWYDEYELTLGDSLLRKINSGLRTSDYGIVVLSPHFFKKKWPQEELDGLFALEHQNRKVILPIWKDIDEAGVRAYSPILAGRLAVSASRGVHEVVAEIQRAVSTGERSREFSQLDGLTLKMRKLEGTLKAKRTADTLMRSTTGVRLISEEFAKLCSEMKTQLALLGADSDLLKFQCKRPADGIFEIRAPYSLRLNMQLQESAMNDATGSSLDCNYYRFGRLQPFNERESPNILETRLFKPYFDAESHVIWRPESDGAAGIATANLLVKLVGKLCDFIETRAKNS